MVSPWILPRRRFFATRPAPLACVCLLHALFLSACGGGSSPQPESGAAVPADGEARSAGAPPVASGPPSGGGPRVVFLGDSLTAGFGLEEAEAFPSRIAESLAAESVPVRIVNAGVSGDTTAGGLSRLGWLLRQEPEILVVGLGANDGLRGLPLESMEENLRQIVLRARGAGCRVLLLGMRIPPNYGPDYAEGFAAIFPRLAEELDVALVPFLLEAVGGREDLNLPDGIHPNPEGQRIVARNVLPYLRPLLESDAAAASSGD